MKSRSHYTAYGGSRGGGKSFVARLKANMLCLRYDGIQILFMRRTYPELRGKPHYSGYAGAERHCGVQERRQGV